MKKLFTNDKFILVLIVINCAILFIEEMGMIHPAVIAIDTVCVILFAIEMVIKLRSLGIKQYWSNGWNCLDGILVLISLPSLLPLIWANIGVPDMSIFLVLRGLRLFRFFKVVHLFPNFGTIMRNFMRALKDSASLFAGYLVIIFLSSMISCALFGERAPEFFGDPLLGLGSTFRLFTIEGWYEIPDAVCAGMARPISSLVYIYFVLLLVIGGIIFMSLLNSVFVDAMVSDNNDELMKELKEIRKELNELKNK